MCSIIGRITKGLVYSFAIIELYLNNCCIRSSETDYLFDCEITIDNFTCITYDWEEIKCTWEYNRQHVSNVTLNWQLIYFEGVVNQVWNPCPYPGNNSCSWRIYEDIDEDQAFNICISLSHAKDSCFYVEDWNLVKPYPIKNLKLISKTSTSVSLEWNHTHATYNKTFRLILKEQGKFNKRIFVNFFYVLNDTWICTADSGYSVNCFKNDVQIIINNLSKFTTYDFIVACKPLSHGFWSEDVYVTQKTTKDIPSAPPNILDGGYSIQQISTKKTITFYWKPLEKIFWNGDNINYKLNLIQNDTVIYRRTNDFSTTLKDVPPGSSVKMRLWSENEIGSSLHQSEIITDETELIKDLLLVEVTHTTFEISWRILTNTQALNYTLFVCQQPFGTCTKPPVAIYIEANGQRVFLPDIGPFDSPAIGLSYRSNSISSGFVWSDCVIFEKAFSVQLDVTFYTELHMENIYVNWYFSRCNVPAVKRQVEYYKVLICDDDHCEKGNRTVFVNSNRTFLHLPKTKTCVQITPYTVKGRGYPSPIRCFLYEKSVRNTALYIIFGISGILFCVVIFVNCRKAYNKYQTCTDPGGIDTIRIKKGENQHLVQNNSSTSP